MPGSLAARDISKSLCRRPGARPRLAGRRARRPRRRSSARTGSASRPCSACSRASRSRIAAGSCARGAVGYLPQEPEARPGETVRGYLARRTGVGAAEREMDALAARLGAEPELAGAYSEALERFLALGGEDFEARVGRRPGGGRARPARRARGLASLSGGEAARAALAAILLARFDVFLLDEPTNNLDFAGPRPAGALPGRASPAGVVLVSHDRAFLDRTVTRVVELEAETRRMHEYTGTWTEYEAARERARAQHEAAYADYVDEKKRYSALLATRREEAHLLGGERKLARQHGRCGPARHERAARQGEPGEEPPRAARGGREAVVALAARARVRRGAADRADRGARGSGRRGRVVHARPARPASCTGATAWRSSARTAPGRRP